MICVLVLRGKDAQPPWNSVDPWAYRIASWFNATDTHDARRQAERWGYCRLAQFFYGREWLEPGKHCVAESDQLNFVVLVTTS